MQTPTVTHVIKSATVVCVFQAIILIKMGDAVLAYQIVVSAQTYLCVNFVLQDTFWTILFAYRVQLTASIASHKIFV